MARLLRSLAFLGAIVLAGCGGSSSQVPKAAIKGTVTLDKKQLKEGRIVFVTAGRAPEAFEIKEGTFEGTAEVGEKRKVEILAYRDAPSVKMDGEEPTGPNKVNYLPARYNSESQLRATVKPDGSLDLKFDLTSNP